ncbi:MAG: glycosyltransferase family 4 protein [Polyangiaceae bacterium]|nr:glycosyltransferase family 4 protein [Polyangiaceae bacterium]MCW5791032.1 glycosyltransferase family 4 protein [Polyangiaceae bacterium]
MPPRAAKPRVLVLTSIRSYHQVDLFDAIAERGELDLTVFYLRPTTPGRQWKSLPEPRHRYRALPVYFNGSLLYLNPTMLSELRGATPELVVVCQYAGISYQAAMLYLTAARVPWVFWSEAPGVRFFEVQHSVPGRLRPALRRLAFTPAQRFAREVWAIGPHAADSFRAMGARAVKELSYYSDLTSFVAHGQSRAPSTRRRFVFLGRKSHRKGFDVLCRAFQALSASGRQDWELTLIGDGELRGLAAELPSDRLTDLGFQELDRIPELLGQHDVLVAPSRYDGWGMVVPEALAAGLTVITTTEMGSASASSDEPQLVKRLPAGDDRALSAALMQALDFPPPDAWEPTRARAMALGQRFDVTAGAPRFAQLAQGVLKRAAGRGAPEHG